MTYNPNIPQATDNISTSQGQILTNFQQLDTIFAIDHYAFDNGTAFNRGRHVQVSFPAASVSAPALSANAGIIYLFNDANDTANRPQIFYRNITGISQVTNRFNNAATSGYCMIAGGIILMWGTLNVSTSGQFPIPFPNITNYNYVGPGFPNNVFNVTFSLQSPSAAAAPAACIDQTSPPLPGGFTLRIASAVANTSVYWMAIGN